MPISHLDSRVDSLFHDYEEIRKAQVVQDHVTIQARLSSALQESCLLLSEMFTDQPLTTVTVDNQVLVVIRSPDQKDELEEFLHTESDLLKITKLSSRTVEELIAVARRILCSDWVPQRTWREGLGNLRDAVCRQAIEITKINQRRGFLKRAFVAGGGGLISIVNMFPPPSRYIPPETGMLSKALGTWLIGAASGSFFDDYFDH